MSVLVLGSECDSAADGVVETLERRGVSVYRLDLGWLRGCVHLAAFSEENGWSGVVRVGCRLTRLRELRAVFYRDPSGVAVSPELSGPFPFLSKLPHVRWVNHPRQRARMGNLAQRAAAHGHGLRIPPSLVTNHTPQPVRRFAAEIDDRVLADRAYSLRLIAVDDGDEVRLFPAARQPGHHDPEPRYTVADVPDRVAAGVRGFMRVSGIELGQFEFRVDTAGEHWFLACDIDATHMWSIENATGLPITAAIADILATGAR